MRLGAPPPPPPAPGAGHTAAPPRCRTTSPRPPPQNSAVVGLRPRARGDLVGGLVGALEDALRLLAHLVESVPDRGLWRAADLELGDDAVHLLHVCVDGVSVVAAQHDREARIADGRDVD